MITLKIGSLHGNVITGDVTVHTNGAVYLARLPRVQPQPSVQRPERRARPRPPTEIDQRDLLLMLEQLVDPTVALDFMEREFGTRVVLELESPQLYKLRWYVGVLISRGQ